MDNPVVCYCGSSYAERPQALFWQGARLQILGIQAQWREPTATFFRVKTTGDIYFMLIYEHDQDTWQIHLIQ